MASLILLGHLYPLEFKFLRAMGQDYRKFVPRVIGALAALLVLMAVCTLLFADRWRYEADQPRRSDAIIVLAGAPERARYAADLYRRGYAPFVYVCRPSERSLPPEEEVNRAFS